jgi:hypothetical protein
MPPPEEPLVPDAPPVPDPLQPAIITAEMIMTKDMFFIVTPSPKLIKTARKS